VCCMAGLLWTLRLSTITTIPMVHELLLSVGQPSSMALGATPSYLNVCYRLLTRCSSLMSLNISFLYQPIEVWWAAICLDIFKMDQRII